MFDFVAAAKEARDWISHPKRMFILSLFFGFVVLSPPCWLGRLGVLSFIDTHRVWFALPLIFCVAVLLVESEETARAKWLMWRRLKHLTQDERFCVSRFLENGWNDTVQMWPWERGVATLVSSHILLAFTEAENRFMVYMLAPETVGYIKKHRAEIFVSR